MNYERIYNEFIADRRIKEAGLVGYAEKHHIVPRSKGGSEEASNLISLTPEDHIRAHILLGRIYGGTMWFALRQMVGQYTKRNVTPSRRERKLAAVGIAKAREFSRSPEGREMNRNATNRMWANPEIKRRHSLAMSRPETRAALTGSAVARYADQANRKATSVAVSVGCNTPEYLAGLSQRSSALMSDPEMRRRIRESNLTAYSDPQLRARIGAAISAANQDNSSQQRRSLATKQVANDPEVANRKRLAMKSLLENKKKFCEVYAIDNPGKSYSNIDKAAFSAWLADMKEAA
jgi:hypothetical protein